MKYDCHVFIKTHKIPITTILFKYKSSTLKHNQSGISMLTETL